jgi:hypothetical protein
MLLLDSKQFRLKSAQAALHSATGHLPPHEQSFPSEFKRQRSHQAKQAEMLRDLQAKYSLEHGLFR